MTYLYLKTRVLLGKLFGTGGALSRSEYVKSMLLDVGALAVVFLAADYISNNEIGLLSDGVRQFAALALLIAVVTFLIRAGTAISRRLLDIGFPAYYTLLLLVPFVNLFLVLFLFFKKGEVDPNRVSS